MQNLLIMKKTRVSFLNTSDIENTVIFKLIQMHSSKKIIITEPNNCDLLFIGPYNYDSISQRIKRKLCKGRFFEFLKSFKKIKSGPLKIFYSDENFRHNLVEADFYITTDFGVYDENHLRIAQWKHNMDWSHEGIFRNKDVGNSKRFGSFYSMSELLNPLGDDFLKRDKKICLISSHLNEPRRSIYKYLSKHFVIDGYGPYFEKSVPNHNKSNFIKKDIMKNYAFSLCPENSLYPGYYTEKITDAFSAKCLPITWADSNVNLDFNINAFVNLIDHVNDNYYGICNLLKDDDYLKKYAKEPLLLKKVDLENEKKFVQKILSLL